MDFNEARYISRMTPHEISDYLDISLRTVKRYQATGKAPKSVIECLLMIGGSTPSFSKRNDFSGWSFGSGFLYSPEGDKFTSGDVRAGKIALLEMNRLYRLEVRKRREGSSKKIATIIQFPVSNQVKKGLA